MVLTTKQLREVWAPPCAGPFSKVALHGDGIVSVRPAIVEAVHALNRCLVAAGYRTRRADTGAYNCRQITGGKGYSLHAFGIAVDLNWQSNPYGPRLVTDMPAAMVAAVKAIRTGNGKQVWRWGGDYSGNRDAMHFEVVCSPADLVTGIDPSTVPGGGQEDDMSPEQMLELKEHIDARVNAAADGIVVTLSKRIAAIPGAGPVDEAAIAAEVVERIGKKLGS